MAQYVVKGESGEVQVEANNWLGALGVALPKLGMSPGALGRLVCSLGADGAAEACDPQTNTRLRIEPVRLPPPPPIDMPAPDITMSPPAFDPTAISLDSSFDEVFELEDSEEDALGAIDAARAASPDAGGAAAPAAEELTGTPMEVVFDRCAVIAAASDVRSACAAALTILAELVPADAGAVMVRTRSGTSLRFAAAFGPSAQKVIDTAIPIEQGIAGFCHGFGVGVIVEDVDRDDRHYSRVDRASGYRTTSLLAVPLLSYDGASCGCMELLNSPTGFKADDLEVARVVAGALAQWLAPALG